MENDETTPAVDVVAPKARKLYDEPGGEATKARAGHRVALNEKMVEMV
jgi:hypothetical protein